MELQPAHSLGFNISHPLIREKIYNRSRTANTLVLPTEPKIYKRPRKLYTRWCSHQQMNDRRSLSAGHPAQHVRINHERPLSHQGTDVGTSAFQVE